MKNLLCKSSAIDYSCDEAVPMNLRQISVQRGQKDEGGKRGGWERVQLKFLEIIAILTHCVNVRLSRAETRYFGELASLLVCYK